MSPTIAATTALTDLVDSAREGRDHALRLHLSRVAFGLANIALDLDAARTRLVQEGEDYIEPAWAFIDAGRRMIAEYQALIDSEVSRRARA